MNHAHDNHPHHAQILKNGTVLKRALAVTATFVIVEFAGGWFANSLALMTDSAHMLIDSAALFMSLIAYWLSQRPASPEMTYGYERAEILGALASGLFIWFLAGLLIFEGVQRLGNPPEVDAKIVILVGIAGLLVNLLVAHILRPRKNENLNLRGAYLHVLFDLLGSVGAVLSGTVLWMTGWRWVDPGVSFLIAGLVLISSWRLVKEAVGILMESTPSAINARAVLDELKGLPSVDAVHDLHIWTVSSGRYAISAHLISRDSKEALAQAYQVLDRHYGIHHTTIQVEHPDHFESDRCLDCEK